MLHFKNAPNINNILKQSFTNATVLSYHPNTYSSKRKSIADQDYPNGLIFGCPFGRPFESQKMPFWHFWDGIGRLLVICKRGLPTQNIKITGGLSSFKQEVV